jgi:Tfp pilus assembly protein PilO
VFRRVALEKRWIVAPIVVAAALNAVMYALVVYPLRTSVAGGEERARAAARTLRAAEQDRAAAEATITGKERAQLELKKFYGEVLPADPSRAHHLMYLGLVQLAQKANLTYERRMLDAERVKDSSLQVLRMTMMLEGSYEDIRRFVFEIERAPEFIVIDNIALGPGRDASGPLALTLELSTFCRASGNGI